MKLKIALFTLCLAAVALLPASAGAIGAAPTVSVTAPANNSFASAAAPALTFTTTGTALSKTCTLTGPGVDEYLEACTSPYKPLATLPEGTYTYGVSVSNTDGSAAASRTFKVDKTNPTITVTDGPAEGAWTSAAGASVSVTVTDANPAYLNCRIDDDLWGDCANGSPTGGTIAAPTLGEGSHRFWFSATDKAGNAWTIFRQINFDRTAPFAQITITGGSSETKDNTPAFQLGSGDNFGQVASRKCRLVGETSAVDCNNSTWLLTDPIGDGPHTAELTVTDPAGNSSVATQAFTVDATMPWITYGGLEGDKTTSTTPTLQFFVDDAHSTTARCAFDAADWASLSDCQEGDHAPASPLALGEHTFWIEAADSFGNLASTIYTFQVVAPAAPDQGTKDPVNGGGSNAAALTLKTSSGKVRKGKFTLSVAVTATNATACGNAEIVVTPKVKKAKSFTVRSAAKLRNGACVATAKVRLAAKFKKKKATITAAQGGVSKKVTIKL